MDQISNQPSKFSNLIEMVQSASLSRLEVMSGLTEAKVNAISEVPLVCGHWMAMALAAGPEMRLTFKVHFDSAVGSTLASRALKIDSGDIKIEKISDFMKEFCNMTLGLVKQVLTANGFNAVISLPLITRGFDEIFFPETSGVDFTSQFWKIQLSNSFVICSVHVELLDTNVDLTKIPKNIESFSSVGDVEFL